jgi:hypothetical protein
MNQKLNRIAIVWAVPGVIGAAAAIVGSHYLPESIAEQARRQAELVPPVRFTTVSVTVPSGAEAAPANHGRVENRDHEDAQCVRRPDSR